MDSATFYKNLGEKIKEAREKRGLSQADLAKILGYDSDTAISFIENGKRKLSSEKLHLISQNLQIPINQLIEDRVDNEDLDIALRNEKGLKREDINTIKFFIEFIKQKDGRE